MVMEKKYPYKYLNNKQATWLYQIRDNENFYNSLSNIDRELITNILSNRTYHDDKKKNIDNIRAEWIRYIKINNNKDI